jgi:hypothetical protein
MIKFVSSFLTFIALSTSLSGQVTDDNRFYPNPGIVAQRGGRWVGSDHLYNLTNNIDIVVEIFKPASVNIPVTEGMIRERISESFKKARINPMTEAEPGQPLLPFFHVLVMIYPIEKGYVAYVEGRLFEKISLDRVRLDAMTALQGITWESQNLILSPTDKIEEQLYKSIDEITNTFVDRFRFYEDIRREMKK